MIEKKTTRRLVYVYFEETCVGSKPIFRLSQKKAQLIINEVKTAVKQWRTVAQKFKLSKMECDRMSAAFFVG